MSKITEVYIDFSREFSMLWSMYKERPSAKILPLELSKDITLKIGTRHFFKVPFSTNNQGQTHVLEVHEEGYKLRKNV